MPEDVVVKTTCARDCYDTCGIAVHTRDGVITKVLGDPDHPVSRGKLCGKCAIAYNGAWRDPELRLTSPLRRTGEKGSGTFAEISWDEALAEIAARLRGLIDRGEAHTIVHTHYTGTVGLIGIAFPLRLFARMGATEVDPDTVCNKAGHAALELTFGTSLTGFDPRTAKDSRCVVIWGANPSHSAPHQDKVFVERAAKAGAKIIVVDPIGHETAAAADIHLKLRPGTDAALAMEGRAVVAGTTHRADPQPRGGDRVDLAVAMARDQHLAAMMRPLDEGRHEMLAVPERQDERHVRLDDLVDVDGLEGEAVGPPDQAQIGGRQHTNGALQPGRAQELTGSGSQRAGFAAWPVFWPASWPVSWPGSSSRCRCTMK